MTLTSATVIPWAAALLFAGFAAVTLAGALLAACARRLVRSVSGLALCFVGLAGLYAMLHSPFLALMQMLIYVGAVCITIMFAMMLADPHDEPAPPARVQLADVAGLLIAGLSAAALIAGIGFARWRAPAAPAPVGTMQDIGHALLGRFGFAFELISVLLLLAILGALVVARSGRRPRP